MKKPIEIREFQSIIYDEKYKDTNGYKCIDKKQFDELVTFIREYTATEAGSDAYDFMRYSRKKHVDAVTFRNYVGLIQMKEGFQVQVLPKIDFTSGEDLRNEKTKKLFLKMLRSMKDFPSKVFNDASLKVDRMNLYEIFINMYIQETRQLVKHGIKSTYVEQEDNLRFYKGKLIVSKHIKENVAHMERFYVSYEEFLQNSPENRLVKATLEKLQKITTSAENAKEIRQLLMAFEMVDSSVSYEKDFSKVVINRNTIDYENLIRWAKVFLTNKSFTTFSGSTTARSLLFPMEKVFESYVYRELNKVFSPDGWHCSQQDSGKYLFEVPKKQFKLRPDIVIKKGDRIVILDTKWKNLNPKETNYGISQEDMYQMYAYSKKYDTSEIWLLYPLNMEMKGHAPIEFYSGDNTYVRLHFIDLENIPKTFDELKKRIEVESSNE